MRMAKMTRTLIIVAMLAVFTCAGLTENAQAASLVKAPKLIALKYYATSDGHYNASLQWKSKKGCTYLVLRKSGKGKYKGISAVRAKSGKTTYVDREIGLNKNYTYTVRQIKNKKGKKQKSRFDKTGLKLMKRPKVTVTFQNLKAIIKWKKVSYATSYYVYRKVGDGPYKKIAKVGKNTTKYTDDYYKSKKNLKSILLDDVFVDPSNNPISYAVRPYYKKKFMKKAKKSWGLYHKDGIAHLEPPTIVSLSDSGTLKWGTVPIAEKYVILRKAARTSSFEELKRIEATSGKYQQTSVEGDFKNDTYAVQAYAKRDDIDQYSKYDTGFTRTNSDRGEGKKVLFLGDSITFGSPYYGEERIKFSYPSRVKQMTGVDFFNPSIPGSTWHYDENTNRHRIVTGVAGMIYERENTDWAYTGDNLGIGPNPNKSTFENYDVVVLAAGTNDYNDKQYRKDREGFFGPRQSDWTKIADNKKTKGLKFSIIQYPGNWKDYTKSYDYDVRSFNGAYNQIMKYIEEGSLKRVIDDKEPIKVITMDLFYSDRVGSYKKRHNRDTTKNSFGYTLKQYQNELNALNNEWSKSPVLNVYRYDTRAEGIVNQSNCPYRASDNLHFTKYAYGLYGNSLAYFLVEKIADRGKTPTEDQINTLKKKYGIKQ